MRSAICTGVTLLALAGCTTRPDDAYEPNDDPAQATVLELGAAIQARANQGNPDYFAVVAEAGTRLRLELRDLGLEDCPAFTLIDPAGAVLFKDGRARCRRIGAPEVHDPRVSFEIEAGVAYRFALPVETSGVHVLRIDEGSNADNIAPYSWDYEILALAGR
ncbi:MAG: hypothetical protein AAF628_16840 [Planctomycetota bacterium]